MSAYVFFYNYFRVFRIIAQAAEFYSTVPASQGITNFFNKMCRFSDEGEAAKKFFLMVGPLRGEGGGGPLIKTIFETSDDH